ncbi:hypothetical protein M436DRAFT_48479 [Aureobasidium namibiae CBS 147.97]|uniref:Uncharacterized protein n=1 Tax=Aureobasidium namibiae CBS 147.97 TaxID=1043004 RepID=A0A074WLV8_9PEZI|nr:uncharacterized protein M436DRAFT_48479 [Aureobasidium namibiae CBS 147.97]KEQ72579.1 hypothetical protein M436DRAFT_48479 [Aureobasidium namibiae CBS 147.97]
MDHKTLSTSRKRARSPHDIPDLPTGPTREKRPRIRSTSSEIQVRQPFDSRAVRLARGELLLFEPDTPICYAFHSCDVTLIKESLHLVHTEDLPMDLNLETMTFSLPKHIDDDGFAIPWLVSLMTCLAWCFHGAAIPDILIAEPELGIEEPYVAVNEAEAPSLRSDLHPGFTASQTDAELSTTASDLVRLFLRFAQGLPSTELATEEQAIFALADFLHNRPDKCKSCVLWRAAWKECLIRVYGKIVAKIMVKKRNFQPSCTS